MKIKRMTEGEVTALVLNTMRAWAPKLIDQALERSERGAEAVNSHNLRRAELAERRLKLAEQREAVAMSAAQTHATTIDDLRRQLEIAQDVIADTSMERDMAEAAYDASQVDLAIQKRRADDLVGEIRALIDDFTDRMDSNQTEVAMTSSAIARGRRDVFSYAVRKLQGLIE